MEPADDEPDRFACPRCGAATEARFYGPCPACRSQLVAAQAGQARSVEAGRYEPAMHVVPNQVATKE
jgi:Zn finger protein HypA/HybF involved in hydrogenase expression